MSHQYGILFLEEDLGRSPSAMVESFFEGVEIARYLLRTFGTLDRATFAMTVTRTDRNTSFPYLQVECIPTGAVLVQLWVPEALSPNAEDGWYNLMDPAQQDSFSDRDIAVADDGGDHEGMVESRLAEGAMFSKKLYVPVSLALESIERLLDLQDVRAAVTDARWKFVGLI